MRWLNYLKPDIKRGQFSVDEVDMIIRLHKLLGNRQVRMSLSKNYLPVLDEIVHSIRHEHITK